MLEIFPIEAGKGILIRVEQGETWLFLSFAGNLVFLSSGNGYVREFLELKHGCEGLFRASREKV